MAVLETIARLERRILERFPESGLAQVCHDFLEQAHVQEGLARKLQNPVWALRIASFIAGTMLMGLFIWALVQVLNTFSHRVEGVSELLQAAESAINELIFLGLALYFLMNLEQRLKRQQALSALHRLRSIAHIVDMHQLTKDPAGVLANQLHTTQNSPERTLNRKQLTRYLDYCSELLALVSKIAALFAQNMEDPIVLSAVNDLESLTQGLASKIWQKIMILDLAEPENQA